jgi:putative alpha-1,2-mannosidase
VPNSAVTGDIAVSPIARGALTGFSLTLDPSGQFSTSTQFTGKAFAADYAVPTPARLTQAVYDMEAAYTAAAARANSDSSRKNIGGGTIGGQTFFPGVYTFAPGVTITSDITFEGGFDDVFIIQIAGTLTQAANTKVLLSGCAQAKNIFWQMSGFAYIGAGASMQGIILTAEKADFITGSSLVGSVLAQTAVNLQMATITQAADTCSTI